MNILLICDEYPPGRHGGIGSAVKLQANALANAGHSVFVAGLYEWGYGEDDNFNDGEIKVFRYRMGLSSSIFKKQDSLLTRILYKLLDVTGIFHWDIKRSVRKYEQEIESLIQEYDIDVVEMPDFNNYRRYCKGYVTPVGFPTPTIVKAHGSLTYIARENGNDVPSFVSQMERDMFSNADAVCSVSRYGGERVMEHLDLNLEYDVLYNGINTQKLMPSDTKDSTKVIFTGTLNENKGIYQLMKAWNGVVAKRGDVRLFIYGKGPVQKIKTLLNEKAKQTVFFEGHVSHEKLFTELGTTAVCVFPSFAENFALAPMEAMASGAAVIYTQRTSGKELIEHGVDGMLVDPADVNSITDSILTLLNDDELRNKISTAGKEKIERDYDISVVAEKHIAYYKAVIEANRHLD